MTVRRDLHVGYKSSAGVSDVAVNGAVGAGLREGRGAEIRPVRKNNSEDPSPKPRDEDRVTR